MTNNVNPATLVDDFISHHDSDDFLVFTRGAVTAVALINPKIPTNDIDRIARKNSAYFAPFIDRSAPYNEIYCSLPGRGHNFVLTAGVVTSDIESVFSRSFRGARTAMNYFRELERAGG